MPGRGLACRRIIRDGLGERIVRDMRTGLEGTDESCLLDEILLTFIAGKPVQEFLSLVSVVILIYCPPLR